MNKTLYSKYRDIAKKYVAKNYSNKFARHTKYYVLSKSTESNGIICITRIDGESFYININIKKDSILHSGPYSLNRGINKISEL